jgi:hypothetical protein
VAFLTLFVNGTSAGHVLKWLKLAEPVVPRSRALRLFELSVERVMLVKFKRLLLEQRFADVNYQVMKAHVPLINNDAIYLEQVSSELRQSLATSLHFDLSVDEEYVTRMAQVTSNRVSDGAELELEMREMFLELLGEAYASQFREEELDTTDDDGINFASLTQSITFDPSPGGVHKAT